MTARRAPASGAWAVIDHVVDGDTVDLRGGHTVRLVQIDTPEVYGGAECGGSAASAALRAQLAPGTHVSLSTEPASNPVDRYGRLLRYVRRGPRNLNVWMVARGHAAPYFYGGEQGRHAGQMLRAARSAKADGLGLGGACPTAVLDALRGVETGSLGGGRGVPGRGAGRRAGIVAPRDAAAGVGALGAPGTTYPVSLPAAPLFPPDRDCADLPGPVRVTAADPHNIDADGDGVGCNS